METFNITSIRGDTLFSPVWAIPDENVPSGITEQDFYDGVKDGTYTLADLNNFEITSNARFQYNSNIEYDLTPYITIDQNYMRFVLPASETSKLVNERKALLYDIQFKEKTSGYVKTAIGGTITIEQEVTYPDASPAPKQWRV